ncbi:MAG: hypothetical protein Q9165_002943 [Trypethelium subeluteriae]
MTHDYNNTHRAFLQAFLSHSTLTLSTARPILAAILTAHDADRPVPTNDITNEDLLAYIHTLNSALSPFDLEIRSTRPQTRQSFSSNGNSNGDSAATSNNNNERIYALVNASGDPAAQLATTYSPEELAFVKRVLDAMFETNNTARAEQCGVRGIQAVQLHKAPRSATAVAGRESTVGGGGGGGGGGAGGAVQGITMAQAERVLAGLVEEGWFERSKSGFYTLSPRGLMELRGWLVDTYNEGVEEGDGEDVGVERVKSCHACKEIIIVSNWEGYGHVGEKAAKGAGNARRTTGGSRRTTNQAVDSDEED